MNRNELIDFVAEAMKSTKASASAALDAVLDGITNALEKAEPVVIVNFGTFMVKERAARVGRNPSTGEKININAARVVNFKAGKALKDAVKEDAKA
ncbi:MAG TPA: HU family DNA-binding protein [Gammaproteobacteria bacterium]|jgi:DNA-binding protein HU-beta|nr:HU family DNA-binding protein [Gammaproteobacteria bacterium]